MFQRPSPLGCVPRTIQTSGTALATCRPNFIAFNLILLERRPRPVYKNTLFGICTLNIRISIWCVHFWSTSFWRESVRCFSSSTSAYVVTQEDSCCLLVNFAIGVELRCSVIRSNDFWEVEVGEGLEIWGRRGWGQCYLAHSTSDLLHNFAFRFFI